MAETLRTLYLADRVQAMWGSDKAAAEAERIRQRLLGRAPKRKKKRK